MAGEEEVDEPAGIREDGRLHPQERDMSVECGHGRQHCGGAGSWGERVHGGDWQGARQGIEEELAFVRGG